jgi:uncharacterized protein
MKRIVVSGATGFIGRRVVRELALRGDAVTALSRDPERTRGDVPEAVSLEQWEPRGEGPIASLDGSDAVVHLAGERAVGARWTAAVKREILESRVASTEHVVLAIERASRRPGVLVCASAVGYYGARGDEPLDESAEAGAGFLAQVTVDWEQAARRAEALGVRVVLARFGIVLGRGGGALAEMAKPFRLFVGGPIGSGRQVVSWVHADDVVGAVLRCIDDAAISGAVNVTAPHAVTNAALSKEIGRVLRRPAAFTVPEAALRLRFGEGAEPLVTGQRAVPRKLEQAGYAFRYPDVGPALEEALGG